jgi:hypothetical protein
VAGATPVLAERVGRWTVEHRQRQVRRLLLSEPGRKWSNGTRRRVVRAFRQRLVAVRAAAQVERVLGWLTQADRSRGRSRPVLAVGRDGVRVPSRQGGYQAARAATVSVDDRRRQRLGTVYLGQRPESKQKTLTAEVTDLVTDVLKEWTGARPRWVYVTDKGQAQDEYYRRTRKTRRPPRRPPQRWSWEGVRDFFPVCG